MFPSWRDYVPFGLASPQVSQVSVDMIMLGPVLTGRYRTLQNCQLRRARRAVITK